MKNYFPKLIYIFILFIIFTFVPFSKIYAISAVVHIPEKYTDINAGERLYFELEIKYPENPTRKDLRLTYQIVKDGKVVLETKVLKAIETQASFTDYITIPEGVGDGLCEIKIQVSDYGSLAETVSASFMLNKANSSIMLFFYIILGTIFIFGLIVTWEIKRIKKIL